MHEPTSEDWLEDLRTLILPPLPSAPTAIKLPEFDSLLRPLLHHLPKYLFVPSGPRNPPEKHMSPEGFCNT